MALEICGACSLEKRSRIRTGWAARGIWLIEKLEIRHSATGCRVSGGAAEGGYAEEKECCGEVLRGVQAAIVKPLESSFALCFCSIIIL